MEYLSNICPDIEQVSVDECYLDYTPIADRYPSPLVCADRIRKEVFEKFGFTVNIGISNRKVLAKMASDFKKPNLTHTLFTTEIREKMWPLPVSSLFMCGKSSVEALRKLEILTIGDLACANPQILEAHLKSHGKLLWEYANGIDDSSVLSEPAKAKGIGNSITLSHDAVSLEEAKTALLSLSESVASRLRTDGQRALMESIEIKYSDFRTVSHQTTFPSPVDSGNVIYETACRLFEETWNHAPIRLLGVRTSKLCPASEPVQLSLFDLEQPLVSADDAGSRMDTEKQHRLDTAIDSIRQKFGENSIVRGSLLGHQNDYKKH